MSASAPVACPGSRSSTTSSPPSSAPSSEVEARAVAVSSEGLSGRGASATPPSGSMAESTPPGCCSCWSLSLTGPRSRLHAGRIAGVVGVLEGGGLSGLGFDDFGHSQPELLIHDDDLAACDRRAVDKQVDRFSGQPL